MHRKAFTLIEVLASIAIIAVLVAVVSPAFTHVRKMANRTDSISNLRQCATALAIYMQGDDLRYLPGYQTAKETLANMPTCDRSDYLRRDCSEPSPRPLIGSYDYIRGVDEPDAHWSNAEDWNAFLQEQPNPYLLASIYYGDSRVVPFDGNDRNPCVEDMSCAFPSRLVRVKLDTSVKVTNYPSASGQGARTYMLFTWGAAFVVP